MNSSHEKRQQYETQHIVCSDDIITQTSPIFATLEVVDCCIDAIKALANAVEAGKDVAVMAAKNNRDKLTAKEWADKYINPIEDLLFDFDSRMRKASELVDESNLDYTA